jgi:hypothetical protein
MITAGQIHQSTTFAEISNCLSKINMFDQFWPSSGGLLLTLKLPD